jgi:hypothetical protein
MLPEDLTSAYFLSDGVVLNIAIDHATGTVSLVLAVRKRLNRNKSMPSRLLITFSDVTTIYINDELCTGGQFSDCTFTSIQSGGIYFSIDPYDNSNLPNNEDNWIIKASFFTVKEM